ncbi:MAG: hypothetical protein WC405_00900 [Syntrophales bacterium]
MIKRRKVTMLLVFSFIFLLMAFSYAFGDMRVHLKSGKVVTIPVNKDDVVSIDLEDTAQVAAGELLETLTIPNDKPVKITSTTVLEKGRWYIIEASGVISDWGNVKDGVDAVWCYAEWRCGKNGEVWNQLRINDKGLTDIEGKDLTYNPEHVYKVRYLGEGKKIQLYCIDAQSSSSDNSGWFTVKIFRQ